MPKSELPVLIVLVVLTVAAVSYNTSDEEVAVERRGFTIGELHAFRESLTAEFANGVDTVDLRRRLLADMWRGGEPLPVHPLEATPADECPLPLVGNISHVTRLDVTLPRGFNSVAWHYRPLRARQGVLMLLHQGHSGSGQNLIDDAALRFVSFGYDVIHMGMPLVDNNRGPCGKPSGPGCHHSCMGVMESAEFNPLELFFDHIPACLEWAIAEHGPFASVNMSGISGGAYTTTLYAAMDPRIQNSFAVSGMLPHFLGDHEGWEARRERSIFDVCSVPEMYVMASDHGRCHTMLLSNEDPYVWVADHRQISFVRPCQDAAALVAGEFLCMVDMYSNRHHFTHLQFEHVIQTIHRR